MAAAQATSSGDVLGTLTSGEISCGQWTTLEITANRLKLVGDATTAYKLDNARFSVGEDGVFRSDVPMELTGDNLPDVVRDMWTRWNAFVACPCSYFSVVLSTCVLDVRLVF